MKGWMKLIIWLFALALTVFFVTLVITAAAVVKTFLL